MPTTVPASATSSARSATALTVRSTGPNQRIARVSAPSTARTKSGRPRVDSRHQLVNGSWVRSMAPTAPRSDSIQNPSA